MSKLEITGIKFYRFNIPLREEFKLAMMSLNSANNVLVKIETNQGIDGWGEGAPFHALVGETQDIANAAAREFGPLLRGRNPMEIGSIIRLMDSHLPHNTTLKSAIDMALFDIAAKVADVPLYLLLGGEKRKLETDMTIGICDPKEAGDKARAIKSRGFNIIKIKLGLNDRDDLARLIHISEAVGPEVKLRIDANQGWDRMQAIRNLSTYSEFNIEFCEQPCRVNDVNGMRFVSDHTRIPIMADESLFSPTNALDLIAGNVAPYFNIKFSKSGGIYNAIKIANIAEAGAIPCMVGCMSETRLGLTAAAHFALSNPIVRFLDLDSHLEHSVDPIMGGIKMTGGLIEVTDEPGIGASPDENFLRSSEVEVVC